MLGWNAGQFPLLLVLDQYEKVGRYSTYPCIRIIVSTRCVMTRGFSGVAVLTLESLQTCCAQVRMDSNAIDDNAASQIKSIWQEQE
jgi:hypothetical protein